MKTMFTNTLALLLGSASTVCAAEVAREDSSGLIAWIFLGFCALIVIAQLIPAVMVILGFAKAFGKQKKETPETVQH